MAKMSKSARKTLMIAIGVVVVLTLGIFLYTRFSSAGTVTGAGQATVKALPDIVGVYFSVETNAATSSEATADNSEIVADLKAELLSLGFEESEIQTISFNVYPDYTWSGDKMKENGYVATHSIEVQLSSDEMDKIGEVIDAGVNSGAGISYINFELSPEKQNEYKALALEQAAEDAKIKAESIAIGLGKRLGRLVSVSDGSFSYYPRNIYSASESGSDATYAKAVATDIQPSEQEVYASVTATFKLI